MRIRKDVAERCNGHCGWLICASARLRTIVVKEAGVCRVYSMEKLEPNRHRYRGEYNSDKSIASANITRMMKPTEYSWSRNT